MMRSAASRTGPEPTHRKTSSAISTASFGIRVSGLIGVVIINSLLNVN